MKSRPLTIILFEILFALTFVVGLIDSLILVFQFPEISLFSFAPMLQLGSLVVTFGLALLVSRKKMKPAIWILIGLSVLGAPLVYTRLVSGVSISSLTITLFQNISQIVGLMLLFTNSSRKWINTQTQDNDLTDTFS